jgi:hypothetical protein
MLGKSRLMIFAYHFFVSKDVVVVLGEAVGLVPLENMLAFIDVLHAQSGYKAR